MQFRQTDNEDRYNGIQRFGQINLVPDAVQTVSGSGSSYGHGSVFAGLGGQGRDGQQNIVSSFLDSNPDGWVIDGNYSKLSFERRAAEADIIIQMLFGRISCLLRCVRRYRRYKGKSRPDMTEGCNEKLDFEFVKWILWEGRSKKIRNRYKLIRKQYPEKAVVIKNQRQLDAYLQERDY